MTSLRGAGAALALGAALLAGFVPAAVGQTTRQQEQFAQRMDSLRALAGALKRQASEKGVDRSETLSRVEARMREADSLAAAGELDLARSVLDEAYQMVRTAIEGLQGQPAAAPAAADARQPSAERAKRDYEARAQSARALRDALARKGAERKLDVSRTLSLADAKLAEGGTLASGGDYARARAAADEAYQAVKHALDDMLDGAEGKARAAGAAPAAPDPRAQQFEQRAGTVKALSDALARMSAEKGVDSSAVIRRADGLAGQARSLRATDPDGAWRALDEAYALVKGAIDSLRGR